MNLESSHPGYLGGTWTLYTYADHWVLTIRQTEESDIVGLDDKIRIIDSQKLKPLQASLLKAILVPFHGSMRDAWNSIFKDTP